MKVLTVSSGHETLVDDDDFGYLTDFKWTLISVGYVGTYVKRGTKWTIILLHRLVMGCTWGDSRIIDHKNGDKLDNQKSNLRLCTHAQNMSNRKKAKNATSQYIGVYFDATSQLWRADIRSHNKKHRLGYFKIEEDAARAYDAAAREFHKEFARPNFRD